jgi:predicted adenylyl cyclase CyaB
VPLPAETVGGVAANPVETEVKYHVNDIGELDALLRKLGFSPTGEQKLQRDEYFDTPEMFSKRLDYVIRLRREDGSLAVALKGPRHWAGKAYSRIELEFPAGDEKKVKAALGRSGFGVIWYFEKRRTTYRHSANQISVAVDCVPELGYFIEIEGHLVGVQLMEKKLKRCLGAQERKNYAELYRAHMMSQGKKPDEIEGASFSPG